jgi:hypothetical protein
MSGLLNQTAVSDVKRALKDSIAGSPARFIATRRSCTPLWHVEAAHFAGPSVPPRRPSRRNLYGMPAYAKEGKVVCFFQSAQKFKSRAATFGFSDEPNLDEGAMWPTSFALKELTAAGETKIVALVKKAVG